MTRILASFRLPIPLDALPTIGEAIERLYGTGESPMEAMGDTLHILEPKGGLGERVRTGEPSIAERESTEMLLRYLDLRDGRVGMSIEDKQNAVLLVSEVMRQWFSAVGGVEYVETTLHSEREPEAEYVFTMQRREGKTPAELRTEAEERLDRIRDFLNQPADGLDERWGLLSADDANELRTLIGGPSE